jgi:hypothetical protein
VGFEVFEGETWLDECRRQVSSLFSALKLNFNVLPIFVTLNSNP